MHRAAAALAVLLCVVPGTAARAQGRHARSDSLRAAAARLEPGTPVRLELRGGDVVTGRLGEVGGEGLRLEGCPAAVPFASVGRLTARGRSTGTGLKVGGIAGGIGGVVGGALIGWVAGALCEASDCAGVGTDILVGGGLGLLAGAAGGGALGAIVGATMPRWVAPERAGPAGVGEVSATGAWSRSGSGAGGFGLGGDLSLLAVFGPVQAGPEAGYQDFGTLTTTTHVPCPSSGGTTVPDSTGLCDTEIPIAQHAWHVGGAVRVDPFRGPLRPYAVGGLGYYSWSGLNLAGYSIGAGLRWARGRFGPELHLEARWHSNLSRAGTSSPLGFFTIGAGGAFRW